MEGTALWKAVPVDALGMDSADSMEKEAGNVDATAVGMEETVACLWNKVVEMDGIMIKVGENKFCSFYYQV